MPQPSVKRTFLERIPHEKLYPHIDKQGFNYELGKGWEWFDYLAQRDGAARDKMSEDSVRREFHYIKYSHELFGRYLEPHMKNAKSFLDVGCGGGDKLAYVRARWPHVKTYGIEHDPAMAAWAGEFGEVWCRDALKATYYGFSIIYAYWPICNANLMEKLIDKIMRTKMVSGKFILVGYEPGRGNHNENCCKSKWRIDYDTRIVRPSKYGYTNKE